jgi:lincosamide nucleotidyltransferase A/C/D/E
MADTTAMSAANVVQILDWLSAGDVHVWLDGGWGVDALLGEQTRAHKDLDLIVLAEDASHMRGLLSRHGFEVDRGPEWNFVLRDDRGREVDVHPVRFDDQGNGHLRTEAGEPFVHSGSAFAGRGSVAGHDVECLAAEAQMLNHSRGYVPSDTDYHDMRRLNARLGTRLLPPYSGATN